MQALNYDPRTFHPDWSKMMEGGVDLMQNVGMATGPRTYTDIRFDND